MPSSDLAQVLYSPPSARPVVLEGRWLGLDGSRPLAAVNPADGATGVSPDVPILITFSESMQSLPADAFLFLEPPVSGLSATWLSPTAVEVSHDSFAPGTTYTLRLGW